MSFWEYTQSFKRGRVSHFAKKLLFLFLFLFLLNAVLAVYGWKNAYDAFDKLLVYAQFVPLVLYAIIVYLLIRYPYFPHQESREKEKVQKSQPKYVKTGLSPSFSEELKSKLEYLMHTKKIYLQHELRLDDIAELLDISRHHASQVINENFKMSFYDYINAYRIEEAKLKLSSGFENSSESISDISYQCGFNNRVSFYKAFKKLTGFTPTEFLCEVA